ncbi:hypothetical protein B0A50_00230 [Salinomyces thailandicus]|uniref:Rab-GAP TBC domain-containing protein n=1 Tax=Salinomyces thailandicus TaxID=706561 RepID=A0A4U0UFB6_9PEZI|nr:hypothetical protein B0A50_00230 [Salinomyces thailandica]
MEVIEVKKAEEPEVGREPEAKDEIEVAAGHTGAEDDKEDYGSFEVQDTAACKQNDGFEARGRTSLDGSASERDDEAEEMILDTSVHQDDWEKPSSSSSSMHSLGEEVDEPRKLAVDTSATQERKDDFISSPYTQSPVQGTDEVGKLVLDTNLGQVYAEGLTSSPQTQISEQEARGAPMSLHSAATSRPATPTVEPVSPITPAEADQFHSTSLRDSMASISLSESSQDCDHLTSQQVEAALATPKVRNSRHIRRPSSLEILQGHAWQKPELERHSTLFDSATDEPWKARSSDEDQENDLARQESASLKDSEEADGFLHTPTARPPRFSSLITTPVLPQRHSDSDSSSSPVEVDWSQLDADEWEEKQDKDLPEGAEDESTAFLLARLDQENAKITAAATHSKDNSIARLRLRSESRPPSMGQLKKLVQDKNPRYSISLAADILPEEDVPEPPPMTELEFWSALVQDYPSTASRLPTLTTSKIRSGIPPPLRGVVWASMSGARDRDLEESFERLQHEKSSYDGQINKDVGRSFPGVELFRDAEGEGQQMLGRVLKCFSLHDKDIGYCQGLGFLVGPLLMNMGEREAFCVLVRLMDHYSLRPSFLPSLSGLHMRIYQFSNLLTQHQPVLAKHFEHLGVEPAYLSQWFLSCFAVTCPLPMLFRIYDVIFAEGANETVMRVALALMRRNESRMLAATEFEEVMQLLLGRGIWDVYGMSADELVDDFTSLGGIITYSRLSELEKEFENQGSEAVGERAGFLPDVQAAASRFLGRLWAPSGHTPTKSTSTLSPQTAEDAKAPSTAGRPTFLRRSPSKQSISTLNESDSSSGPASLASTLPTDAEAHDAALRESQATDPLSFRSNADSLRTVSMSTGHNVPGPSKEERDAHVQIEDLLTALSEMQREQQQLAAMVQREREERGEDQVAVKKLVQKLRHEPHEDEMEGSVSLADPRRRTLPPPPKVLDEAAETGRQRPKSLVVDRKVVSEKEQMAELIEKVDQRLQKNNRISVSFETKAQLRDRLARAKESLTTSESNCREMTASLEVAEGSLEACTSENDDLRAEVRELRIRVNEEFKARQKLEHTIHELRAEARIMERKEKERLQNTVDLPNVNNNRNSIIFGDGLIRRGTISSAPVSSVGGSSGLRELKLGRRDSTSSVQTLRSRRQRMDKEKEEATLPSIQLETRNSVAHTEDVPDIVSSPVDEDEETPASPSPPQSASTTVETPASATGWVPPQLHSPKLQVPKPSGASPWHARTSSLATREVFSTPQHEVVPDEALLLELVNSKTSEAQSRAEVDELRRTLTMANRRHDAMLAQLRAEVEAAKAAAEVARLDTTRSAQEMPGLSVSGTPAGHDSDNNSLASSTQGALAEESKPAPPKKAGSETRSPSGGGGGWFWGRRAASNNTPKAVVTPPAD